MKNSYLLLTMAFFSLTAFSPVKIENPETSNMVSTNIDSYLESINFQQNVADEVTIFSNFLVKENGDFIIVDFMVEEQGEVTVLNQEFDEEYYLFDTYSTEQVLTHTSPVAVVRPSIIRT